MALSPNSLSTTSLPSGGNDFRSLDALRGSAVRDPKSSIRETAKQFESLFMQEVMKSMRAATMSTEMMDNSATKLGTEMLDTQFAGKMTGLPGGLSGAIERHLQRQLGISGKDGDKTAEKSAVQALPALAQKGIAPHVQSFIQKHDSAAKAAEAQTGIPASFMLAQAAHESGWGKREITGAGGTPSFNVFGIKATSSWTGRVAEVQTTEFIDGKPQKVMAKFRAYASYEESFKDYAKMIGTNERYSKVVAQAQSGGAEGFARGLQKAGYATDPEYAQKLARVINTTVRVQRALA
ncbi:MULTISPECIES: flagellar assembly peptidoglycan hydrolase FlgJ [Roseateles]|uniref:Peptidoglycan hydrolase FlgJ n=1 Tax=Roseateles albus TaxID=2987525 RepID=A0ABT5KIJ9_9BURK|nr:MULTISPECIES: flagellar assembly peptidoglycan hydrolase FlgJ [Roseateles]MCV2359220.1 flagellar assembly peptidoglycan hydrolase FlgJ [Paucibacter sp. TC2R-5]MDC8773771.1 flagellar assembly peptidoglycan hydrolase FlgJ [Roseateles albus]